MFSSIVVQFIALCIVFYPCNVRYCDIVHAKCEKCNVLMPLTLFVKLLKVVRNVFQCQQYVFVAKFGCFVGIITLVGINIKFVQYMFYCIFDAENIKLYL